MFTLFHLSFDGDFVVVAIFIDLVINVALETSPVCVFPVPGEVLFQLCTGIFNIQSGGDGEVLTAQSTFDFTFPNVANGAVG